MRFTAALIAIIFFASSALASPLYYGPKSGPFGVGYKEHIRQDGVLRIVAEYRSSSPVIAVNVALYRAAELARNGGHRYVQILNGSGSASYGVATAIVMALPVDVPDAPATCRAKGCYTADVAIILNVLGDFDRGGSGFGVGAVGWKR